MMEGDENIDEFALEVLRRAKERSQAISGRFKHPEPEKGENIEKIMESLDKKHADAAMKSPEKVPTQPSSPLKQMTRPILKQMSVNDEKMMPDNSEGRPLPVKKCVTTFDADGTIVEAKTFISDNENDSTDDEEMEYEEEQDEDNDDNASEGDNIDNLPKDEELDSEEDCTTAEESNEKANTTPQLSRTLQKLAEFHSKEVDSPVHSHTPLETFNCGNETEANNEERVRICASRTARSSRLSALARTINEWEDDTTHLNLPGSRFSEVPSNNSRSSLSGKSKYSSASSLSASSPKRLGGKQGQISGELQGYSRRQGSPLKQLREKSSPETNAKNSEEIDDATNEESPSKVYFGGSPFKGNPSPKKYAAPLPPPLPTQSQSPKRSPIKSTPPGVRSPVRSLAENRIPSTSPNRSPLKSRLSASPVKIARNSIGDGSTVAVNPVSSIRMQFEGSSQGKVGPTKPERSHLKPYSAAPEKASNSSRYSASSPVKKFHFGETEKEKDPSCLSVAERAKLFEKSNFCPVPRKPIIVDVQPKNKKATVFTSSPCFDSVKPNEIDISSVTPVSSEPSRSVKRPAPPPPAATLSGCPPPPPPLPFTSTPTNSGSSKRRSTSPSRPFPAEAHAVKRIKVNAPKPGRIYPSLTDIETEAETEAEGHCSDVESMDDSLESQQSLGAEIETIAKGCSPIRATPGGKIPARYRPSEDFSATFACETVDALIDEALEGQDMTGTTMNFTIEEEKTISDATSLENTIVQAAVEANLSAFSLSSSNNASVVGEGDVPEEVSFSEADTTASSSFTASPVALSQLSALSSLVNVEKSQSFPIVVEQPISKNMPGNGEAKIDEEAFVPRQLVHTVSFYRKQQQQQKKSDACSSGLNYISEQPESCEESDEEVPAKNPNPGDMIRKLEDEVEGRNMAIAQASKALTWCKTLVGFSDSTEYIEGERILLIETQRRLALLNSIHRLKTEGALNHQLPEFFSPSKQDVTPSCKGTMNISDISVTLRREFFNAHRAECQYHFICLLKNKHHIDHTALITYESQRQGPTIKFPNEFLLQGLDPDFQVNLQIYYLESAKEFLPHEAKYRINAKKDKQTALLLSPLLTPSKKSAKGDHSKHAQSPAGPDIVKSTSFKFCGGLSIDISSLQRTYWELDKASGPLTGGINIKVQCSAMGGVEHKGFLTLFEDVSGYGAWVRRWCRLGPAVLEFWKYPEDETEGKKPPLGTLNLHDCVTSRVRPAPRDVCARANTLLLVTTRAPHPNDKNTLVISCRSSYTAVRHLISADTRDERDIWCQSLNRALANLRAWDPVAKQSVDDSLF